MADLSQQEIDDAAVIIDAMGEIAKLMQDYQYKLQMERGPAGALLDAPTETLRYYQAGRIDGAEEVVKLVLQVITRTHSQMNP